MNGLHKVGAWAVRAARVAGLLAVICVFFGAPGSAPAHAAEAKTPVFAIIDIQRILRESMAVRALSDAVQGRRTKVQAELREKEKTLRAADQELARQRTILSAEVFGQKRQELAQKVAALQREAKQRRREFDRDFSAGMAVVQKELAAVAREIAQERGLDLILSKATVVIVRPEFDLSKEALDRLNAKLPKIAAPPKQD
ncbi:MAG: OmpH family outer membrane protein [Kiloniellaceae bacterium]